ncbi:MAG: SpoIIE family protein phosphatase [Chloroflexota bacterium]
MEIQIAVAKAIKHGSLESGDSVEIIERPNGGLSVVMCDGLTSGREAKMISGMVVRKVIALIADGIRDGAAARAASDLLFTERNGQYPVYLNILSADLQSGTIVLSRNNPMPIFIAQDSHIECLAGETQAIGTARNIRPLISEITLKPGTTVVMYTDGVANAGVGASGMKFDVCSALEAVMDEENPTADRVADALLGQAIRFDSGEPRDDMTVCVLRILESGKDQIRRLSVRLPVPQPIDQEE